MTDIEAEEVQVQPTVTDVVEGAFKTSVMSYPSINQRGPKTMLQSALQRAGKKSEQCKALLSAGASQHYEAM